MGEGTPGWLLGVHRLALSVSVASILHNKWLKKKKKTANHKDKTGPGMTAHPDNQPPLLARDIRASHSHGLLLKREMNTFSEGKD